ncbi:universal stress protein [Alicyclobacillus sp. ALC3]|uniref:universal stress protein n=1 Tax=Alicyclobacillus sp. ALC3 TaxID=2796143 RepID=UPI0023785799|nr:universal stress protein [Alicyclobacillus sp. ALC3]WDL97481.1 universal stress protein [Alicyclobacillus sp. ALC3]
MKKILLATDGSNSSVEAGRQVRSFLTAFPEAQLLVVYVIAPMAYSFDTGTILPDIERHEREAVEEARESFVQVFADDPRVRFFTSRGVPANVICDLADKEQVDLIVVGSHGKGSVQRALLGSVSQAVVRHATVPVLVVRGQRNNDASAS